LAEVSDEEVQTQGNGTGGNPGAAGIGDAAPAREQAKQLQQERTVAHVQVLGHQPGQRAQAPEGGGSMKRGLKIKRHEGTAVIDIDLVESITRADTGDQADKIKGYSIAIVMASGKQHLLDGNFDKLALAIFKDTDGK
jgi:hypothetical protein